jgi:tetratricopeptide (TPR) repeat protein
MQIRTFIAPYFTLNYKVVYATKAKIFGVKIGCTRKGKNIPPDMDRIEKLKEFLRVNPRDCFVQHALALEYIKEGDDESARALFEQILINEPGYIGSYYHLAKLLERTGRLSSAIDWYEKGMSAANQAGDRHTYMELRGAWEELVK